MTKRKFPLGFAVRWLVALGLLALLCTQVPWSEVWSTMRATPVWVLVAGVFLFVLVRWIMALQMHVLLPDEARRQVGVLSILRIQMAAAFYGLILPGELAGGGVIWWKLSRVGAGPGRAGWVVVYLRITLLFGAAVLAVCGLLFNPALAFPGMLPILIGAVAFLLAGALVFVIPAWGRCFESVFEACVSRFPLPQRLDRMARAVPETLSSFREDHSGLEAVTQFLGSLIQNAFETSWFWVLAQALGIDVGFWNLAWIRGALVFLQLLPITVGGLGVREISLVAMLGLLGIAEAHALAFSLIIFAVTVCAGLIGFASEWGDWVRYRAAARAGEEALPPKS